MPVTKDDPIAPEVDGDGNCARCGGHGMVQVRPAYAERKHPGDLPALAMAVHELDGRLGDYLPDDETGRPDRRNTAEYVALVAERAAAYEAWDDLDRKRRLAEQDVYPCPACRESLFLRWTNGCLDRDHHASTCERCLAVLGKTEASRHDRHAFPGQVVR